MRKQAKTISLVILSSVLVMAISDPAEARTERTRVMDFQNLDGTPVANPQRKGVANLDRNNKGATLRIRTTGLTPGSAYTVWWVIFNNPYECMVPNRCSDADFGNPAVEASVLNASGRVAPADGDGKVEFYAFLPVGYIWTNPSSGNGRHLFGPGLQNVEGAEIHFVIKCHGMWTGNVEQISTFNGDCINPDATAFNGCYDPQAGVFSPPAKGKK